MSEHEGGEHDTGHAARWLPPCPYADGAGDGADRACGGAHACRCRGDVRVAVEEALASVFRDLASKAALGLDRRSAIAALARADHARDSDKSVSRAVHAAWTPAHEEVHGPLPCDRTMRRYYHEAFARASVRREPQSRSGASPDGSDRRERAD